MTPQKICEQLEKALEILRQVDDSQTFQQMLADESFVVDDDDMSYLIHQFEVFYSAALAFAVTNEKKTSTPTTTASDLAVCAANFGFAPNQD